MSSSGPYRFEREPLGAGRWRSRAHAGAALSRAEVARLWEEDEAFRDVFLESLASTPTEAFLWETPPVSRATCDRPFEEVFVASPTLARAAPDSQPFADRFAGESGVLTFPNLGGDAELVVPCPDGDPAPCAHLAAFVRGAARERVHALWSAVGRALRGHLETSDAPAWVSTSGLGVYWVHVRLDAYPKYYAHGPYRTI